MMISAAFTPLPSLLGGLLIGLSASILWLGIGRAAGVSGIWARLVGGDFQPAFVAGLLTGGAGLLLFAPGGFGVAAGRSLPELAAAGVLVGLGTRMGSGCTSGHGVCGLSRRSPRSLAAVLTFLLVGFATASAIGAR
jgi:uncharacterized protein